MSQPLSTEGLRASFDDIVAALKEGDLDRYFDYFDEDSETLDEDYPWRMNKADFIDHINFHAAGGGPGMWEYFEWVAREVNVKVWGETGLITGFSTLRGKPHDAGFRQRFMAFSMTWRHADGRWILVGWHQSMLAGQIAGASPS